MKSGDAILSLDDHEITDKSSYKDGIASYPVGSRVRFKVLRDGKHRAVDIKISSIPKDQALEFALHWLGVRVKNISKRLALKYRLTTAKGVVITHVAKGGATGRIGVQPGDVIRQVNQNAINGEADFKQAIAEAGIRDSVLLLVQRGRNGYYITLEP